MVYFVEDFGDGMPGSLRGMSVFLEHAEESRRGHHRYTPPLMASEEGRGVEREPGRCAGAAFACASCFGKRMARTRARASYRGRPSSRRQEKIRACEESPEAIVSDRTEPDTESGAEPTVVARHSEGGDIWEGLRPAHC